MTQRTDHEVLVSIAQLLEELLAEARHTRAARAPDQSLDYAYTPGDRDENGETDIERARRLDDESEDQEPDIDDSGPPDYGPPGSGAVIVEYD